MSREAAQSTEDLGPSISTFPSGARFFYHSPTFLIEDIAHALGMQCRFNGMVRHFYSVAEHSVIVSLLMKELDLGDPMEGLLHDAHEAYVGDMVSPWKPVLPEWKRFEDHVELAMREHFYLPKSMTYGCKQADHIARHIEAWYLKPGRGADMADPHKIRGIALELAEKRHWRTLNLMPAEATAAFLKQYHSLRA